MSEPQTDDELERLAALARRASAPDLGDTGRRLLRASLLARVDSELARAADSRRPWLWALPALAAGVALAVWGSHARSLSYEVRGAARDGAYVRAPSDHAVTVEFSDQTSVLCAAGSRLRVEETDPRGARVLVERGGADVHVVHRSNSAWTFVAGPFEVLVTGTRFGLDWDPVRETFELNLLEGSVEIRGPKGSGPVAVRAGQHFHGDALGHSMVVSDANDAARAAVAGAAPPPSEPNSALLPTDAVAEPPSAAPDSRSDAPARPEPAKTESWQQRITRGQFASIVAEAEQRGVPNCLNACSAADLRALSDAARYTGRAEVAEQSLLALRKRFAGGAGHDAAFSLGRLEEHRGALAVAQGWYDTYLREAPSGAFAAEALAGKMRAVSSLQGKPAAAPLARDYLSRFPKGVHVNTAREILGEN
ncbi:MAG TPA: FecR domain-containing protein [Polyangiaceae bacterium]